MTGGTRKRGKTWSYYFDIGTIDGKRRKKEKGGFRTKKEAEAELSVAIAKHIGTGQTFEPSEISFCDFIEKYYNEFVLVNLRYNSQVSKRNIIDNHLVPFFGEFKLKAITSALIQDFLNGLKLKGYSKSTLDVIASSLSAALDYAVEPCNFLQTNPTNNCRRPKVEKKKREKIILSADDWNRIIEKYPLGHKFHIPLMIGYNCGLRIAETLALTWNDVDFESNTIAVNKQLIKRQGTGCADWFFEQPKTDKSVRTIKFGQTLRDELIAEKERQKRNEEFYGGFYTIQGESQETDEKNNPIIRILSAQKNVNPKMQRVEMVCIDENGVFVHPDAFKYAAVRIQKDLGIKFDFHSLRHTHATILIENGVSPKTVQNRLGHTTITTTLQTYVHTTEQMENEAVEVFEKNTKMPPKK